MAPCSHVTQILYLMYCIQNDIAMKESNQNEKPLRSINLDYVYKKWALKNKKTCIPTCQSHGYNKETMIKCKGCHNACHYKCLEKETRITKQYLKSNNNELMCNVGQSCLHLRNQTFIKKRLQKKGY